ncbi:MAG: alpha-amylase family glycosyl hydrolase, partial [Acidobacteriota bacterium]
MTFASSDPSIASPLPPPSAARLDALRAGPLAGLDAFAQDLFFDRLVARWPRLTAPLWQLYGPSGSAPRDADAAVAWLDRLIDRAARAYAARSGDLRRLDALRADEPDGLRGADQIGYIAYVDRFAGTLEGVRARIPYLRELGVTYLHLLPLLMPRPHPNDGGFAVADYTRVAPRLGTMDDLERLAADLRAAGIRLCIDLVCNHTAREHDWAQAARRGDPHYASYYHFFPNRTLPDQYEPHLFEVFPQIAPGNFTRVPEINAWVWTTFYSTQWDLNYAQPAVFAEMLEIMWMLANRGVEVLRLDAVPFMWKRVGTSCQNLPEVYAVLQGFRAWSNLVAPALVHKAEAIVAPADLMRYFGDGASTGHGCGLAYHAVFMGALWDALATGRASVIRTVLARMPSPPANATWVTYARCHDELAWAFADDDLEAAELDPKPHRDFLGRFYLGEHPMSFARGELFARDPSRGSWRIDGTLAS